jgi:PEP-CTERM motif
MKSRIGLSLVAMMAMVGANTALANTITWQSVTDVNYGTDSQVLGTAGGYTYVEAVTAWKTANLTVNGVTFLPLDTVGASASYTGAGHITQTLPGAITDAGWTYMASPASGTPTDYETMLVSTAWLSSGFDDGAITLAGLSFGKKYRVQVWAGQWNNDQYATVYDTISLNPSGNNQRLAPPNFLTPPQFVVGTFTADAAVQTISIKPGTIDNNGLAGVRMYAGAISLFEAGGQPVPEPGTWLLLGGSLLGLCVGGFKRIRSKLNV